MPYKTREGRIAHYHKWQKQYMVEFRKTHKDEWNTYQNEYHKKRRQTGEYNQWDIVKKDPIKKQKYNCSSLKYWEANKEILKEKQRDRTKNLETAYVVNQLVKELGIGAKYIRKVQVLIDIKKTIIQIRREIKWQRQKTKTSEPFQI